jgi:hypothetical protein
MAMTTLTEKESMRQVRRLVIKSEMRRLQKVGSAKGNDKHSALLSFPKSYMEEFNLQKGDRRSHSRYAK